uniref:Uncharacterized protein n=1 Tax=Anopheles merus TaxID=30066 RepID=A0A182V6R2_ANOME
MQQGPSHRTLTTSRYSSVVSWSSSLLMFMMFLVLHGSSGSGGDPGPSSGRAPPGATVRPPALLPALPAPPLPSIGADFMRLSCLRPWPLPPAPPPPPPAPSRWWDGFRALGPACCLPLPLSLEFASRSRTDARWWNCSIRRCSSSTVTASSGCSGSPGAPTDGAAPVAPSYSAVLCRCWSPLSSQAIINSGCWSVLRLRDVLRETADLARRISDILPRTGFSPASLSVSSSASSSGRAASTPSPIVAGALAVEWRRVVAGGGAGCCTAAAGGGATTTGLVPPPFGAAVPGAAAGGIVIGQTVSVLTITMSCVNDITSIAAVIANGSPSRSSTSPGRFFFAIFAGDVMDERPHMMRRSSSPVMLRFFSSFSVTRSTLFQLLTAPLRWRARVLLLLLITMTPRVSYRGSSDGPSPIEYSSR